MTLFMDGPIATEAKRKGCIIL